MSIPHRWSNLRNESRQASSLFDYCRVLSRLGKVEASFTLLSLLHHFTCFLQSDVDILSSSFAPRDSLSKLSFPLGLASVHLADEVFFTLCVLALTHMLISSTSVATRHCSCEHGIVLAAPSVGTYTCSATQKLLRHHSLAFLLLQEDIAIDYRLPPPCKA